MFKNSFYLLFICSVFLFKGCTPVEEKNSPAQYLVILGTVQDAGYPHINYPEEFTADHNQNGLPPSGW